MIDISEYEWRKIRDMKPAVLDHVCKGILDALRTRIDTSSTDLVHHEQYLNIYKWLHEQDKEIANGFDDLKRSNAYYRLACWVKNSWLTLKEFNSLSKDTRAKVLFLAGLDQYTPPEI